MKRFIPVLTVILVFQVVLTVSIHLIGREKETMPSALTSISSDSINRIAISDDKKKEVILARKDGTWVVENKFNFAADSKKIENDLNNIANLKIRWPVAATASAADRFKVGEDTFKRKIVLQQDAETKATLYLGDATGAHGSYARIDKKTDVYPVSLTLFEYSTDPDQWIDRHQLKITPDTISSIEVNDVHIKRNKDVFTLDGVDKEQVDKGKIEDLVATVSDPVLDGILGVDDKPVYNLDKPTLMVTIGKKDGSTLTYRFSKPKEGSYYVLKPAKDRYFFKVAEWQVNNLLKTQRASFLKANDTKKTANTTSSVTPDSGS